MYDTLMKFQTRKKFADYEKSVNNLYNMYYEMLEQPIKEDIFNKIQWTKYKHNYNSSQ